VKIQQVSAQIFLLCAAVFPPAARCQTPFRIGIIGMTHGHIGGILNGGAANPASGRLPSRLLSPAGGILTRHEVQIVGIVEPNRQLFDQYAERWHLDSSLYFSTIDELIARAHPKAVMVFTPTSEHTRIVEECASKGLHVMMEKPLAVSYKYALAMAAAARKGHIHVLVDFETNWYASNKAAYDLIQQGALGHVWKIVAHHGNSGPFGSRQSAAARPSGFGNWLTDPKLNGAGALFDFGCYGANLITWLMKGQAPSTVTAVTRQVNPDNHTQVDDESNIILTYPSTVGLIEASWNWPFSKKDIEVYGKTGAAKTVITDTFETDKIEVRRGGEKESELMSARLAPPYDDPLHYFAAVVNGEIREEGSLASIETNVIASEILDAARRSAQSGKTVALPLEK
jgi:glucose-fructose oxidoreductase